MDTLTFWATVVCSFFIGSSVEYDENGKMISEDNDLEYELDVQFMQTQTNIYFHVFCFRMINISK